MSPPIFPSFSSGLHSGYFIVFNSVGFITSGDWFIPESIPVDSCFADFRGVHRVDQTTAASSLDFLEHSGDYCWFPAAFGLDFVNFPGDCWALTIDPVINFVNSPGVDWEC